MNKTRSCEKLLLFSFLFVLTLSFTVQAQWERDAYHLGVSLTDSFEVELDARVSHDSVDALVTLTQMADPQDWDDNAVLVRFNTDGVIDARNGDEYTKVDTLLYTADSTYHIKITGNMWLSTYSVWVTPPGDTTAAMIADNFTFRTAQIGVPSLNYYTETYSSEEEESIEVSNVTAVNIELPAPSFQIVIDGEMDLWYKQLTDPTNGHAVIPSATHNDNGAPDDAGDLSAKLWTAWDSTYLYVYQEVKDNVVNVNNPTSYQNDVFELYFDPDPWAEVTSGQAGITITALDTPDVDEANWSGITNLTGNGSITTDATPADYARVKVNDGYVIEARLKWDWIADDTRSIDPTVGNKFGLATMNHDNDAGEREGSISWATVLLDNVWNTPEHHGTVEFSEDHKLILTAMSSRDTSLVNDLAELYVPNDMPEPWLAVDIGDALDMPGEVEYDYGTFKVKAAGNDIWGEADGLRTVFQTQSGDLEITAKVASLDSVHEWAKAGVMIRDELTAGSKHAYSCVTTGNGTRFQNRPETDGSSNSADDMGTLDAQAPYWVKLIRQGDTFTAYSSPDGEKWNMIGSADIVMQDPVHVGIAATSHVTDTYTNVELTDVSLSKTPTEPELDFTIVMDAEKDPWYRSLTGPDNGFVVIPAATHNDNGAPDDARDLSAKLWTAWDSTYLYVYQEVKDNVVNVNNPTSYQNDVFELYFDPDPWAEVSSGQAGITITALDTPDVDEANWSGITNLTGNGSITTDATPADYARAKVSGGYVIEARLKWDWLADDTRSIDPAVGSKFGLATMNHDNDAGEREGSVSWATVLLDNVWNTPEHHGTVEFANDHKLVFTAESSRDTSLVNELAPLYVPNKLPEDWLTMNIGDVGLEGGVTESDRTWEVTGGGADIWGTEDAFRFAFQVLKGDAELTAQLTSLTKSHDWTKGAVMIRDDLTPDAKHAIMAMASENGQAFQYRPETAGESQHAEGDTEARPPQWLRLIRFENTLSGWVSEDGKEWFRLAEREIAMDEQIYVGMAVTAHDNTMVSTGTFTDVRIKTRGVSGVEEDGDAGLPKEFSLRQNYPNPFNPATTIEFSLPIDAQVQLTVFDILGREVTTLIDRKMEAGQHNVSFDASKYASGVYFYRLKAGDQIFKKKMMLLK